MSFINQKTTGGFSLLEVLVSVFIASIGILGVLNMQLASFGNNLSAYQRSQANYLAMNMLDRMRANPDGVANTDYDSLDTTIKTLPTDPKCMTAANGCDATALATSDFIEWALMFKDEGLLPNAEGKVSYDGGTGMHTVTISWSERDWVKASGKKGLDKKQVTFEARLL